MIASMGAASSACLWPAEYKGDEEPGPYPPQIDRETLVPKAAKTQLGTMCSSLQLAADITDRDSPILNFRWVANNGVDNTTWLEDDDSTRDPGEAHRASLRFQHADFDFEPTVPSFTGVVSLFVTDAPAEAWTVDPNDVPPGESRDMGRIDDSSGRVSVVEVRWTFEYLIELGEVVCQPAD
jgi:hypothetical protein